MIVASYLLHPLGGLGYQFFSGIGSSISEWAATLFTVGTGVTLWWKHHSCHVEDCHVRDKRWLPKRLSWHPHPDHGHPVCKHHHPENPRGHDTHVAQTHRITAEGRVRRDRVPV